MNKQARDHACYILDAACIRIICEEISNEDPRRFLVSARLGRHNKYVEGAFTPPRNASYWRSKRSRI